MKTPKVEQIKKMENGKIAVRWVGEKKFRIIDDERISQYLMWLFANGEAA